MSRQWLVFSLLWLTVSLIGLQVEAADGGAGAIGILYGFSVPDADSTSTHRVFGVKGATFLAPMYSIGGYYLSSSEGEGTGAREFSYSLHGIENALHIASGNGDAVVAFRVGLSKVRTTQDDVKFILSPYHYGFAAGYDYFITSWLSFGFEGSYMYVQKSNITNQGVKHEEEGFGVIQFLAALQLRL